MPSYIDLPDHSKVWVYQSNRMLVSHEIKEIKKVAEVFLQDWAAHGKSLMAAIFSIIPDVFSQLTLDID